MRCYIAAFLWNIYNRRWSDQIVVLIRVAAVDHFANMTTE
jgi:hypothetical protein